MTELGSILGGAFAATIAQWIISTYNQSWLIGVYIAILSVISLIAVTLVKSNEGADLRVSQDDDVPARRAAATGQRAAV